MYAGSLGSLDTQLHRVILVVTGTIKSRQTKWLPVLANVDTQALFRSEHTKRILNNIKNNPHQPLFRDIKKHPFNI